MLAYYLLLIVMTFLGSAASLFLKKASGSENMNVLMKNKNVYIGGFLYFISAVINILLLRYLDYSVVLPLTSFTYIWTMLLSSLILKEIVTGRKIAGLALILLGVVFVSANISKSYGI